MPEAGFITAAIQWFEDKHWVPKSGIVAAFVPGTFKTTDQAKKRQENSGKIANSAVGMELHQQMLERPHLEARQLAWDRAALAQAKVFIMNAKEWYESHTGWMPTFVRSISDDPQSIPLVWPPNRTRDDNRRAWTGRGRPERLRQRQWMPMPKIRSQGGLRIGRVASRPYIAKCKTYEAPAGAFRRARRSRR